MASRLGGIHNGVIFDLSADMYSNLTKGCVMIIIRKSQY